MIQYNQKEKRKEVKKMKYAVNTIHTRKTFDNIKSATLYFNQLIEWGFTYVELAEVISERPVWYSKSLRIFHQ